MDFKQSILASPGPQKPKEYFLLYIKGFLMGIADLIPGVSGGTIAFITGIYADLLAAIGSLNSKAIKALSRLDLKTAISQVHVRFLATLILGILTAIFSLAHLMHYLITSHAIVTWGFFFGLIIASIIIIFKKLEVRNFTTISFIVLGAIFAYLIVGLIPVDTPEAMWFIYLCGLIGISAMILPGLSGSFLLLILGKYEFITACLKNPFAEGNLTVICVFALGTLTGLLSFCKLLNYLLNKYYSQTIAFLIGILIGSLRKVWPWKEVLESVEIRGKLRVLRDQSFFPTDMNNTNLLAFGFMIIGFGVVILMEKYSNKESH